MKISYQKLKEYLETHHQTKKLPHQSELLDIAKHVVEIDFRTSASIPVILKTDGAEDWKDWESHYTSHNITLTKKHTNIEILLIPKKATSSSSKARKNRLPLIIWTSKHGLDINQYEVANEEFSSIYYDYFSYTAGPYLVNNTVGLLSVVFKVKPELSKEIVVEKLEGRSRLDFIE